MDINVSSIGVAYMANAYEINSNDYYLNNLDMHKLVKTIFVKDIEAYAMKQISERYLFGITEKQFEKQVKDLVEQITKKLIADGYKVQD